MKPLALALALMLPATAFAEEGDRPDFELALTLSPLVTFASPFVPGAELTGEWFFKGGAQAHGPADRRPAGRAIGHERRRQG